MAATWELILHHTYAGTPGVVFDLSPQRGAHGTAINLPDTDFLTDGASPGSGAVDFRSGGHISVRPSQGWDRLGGVRGEVMCAFEDISGSVMVDAGSFVFYTYAEHLGCRFNSAPFQQIDLNTHNDPVVPSFSLPLGKWVRLRFVHDGVSTAELSVDGQPVARINEPLWPVNGTNSITIGDAINSTGSYPENMLGRIDTVRIWRLNPHRPDQEFLQRPLDEEVKDCWANWTREMGEALYSDPDCANTIQALLVRAVESVLRDGLNGSDDTRAKWLAAIAKYRELWRSGELENIVPLVADLVSFLLLQGLDPRLNPDVIALLNNGCLGPLLERAPAPECDPGFKQLITDLAATLELRDRNRSIQNAELP